jgi:hypothetical protein
LNISNALIKSSLMYGSETWRLTENNKRRVEATEMDSLRRSSRISVCFYLWCMCFICGVCVFISGVCVFPTSWLFFGLLYCFTYYFCCFKWD